MGGHSHDGIDWDTRLRWLRESDALAAPETAELAAMLLRTTDRSVTEVGAGAGGSAAAFAGALVHGGVVNVVDSAQELLSAATAHAREAAAPGVEVRPVQADAAGEELRTAVDPADLVFASFVLHHLPDEVAGLHRLAALTRPGGQLAVVEFGLEQRCLPWDVGIGEPGLEDRLTAARNQWFREMRAGMPDSVRRPVGWSRALAQAGLIRVRSWSYLIDRPAPVSGTVLDIVLRRMERLRESALERCSAEDVRTLDRLLDAESPHYLGHRDDVYYLTANTVHVGTRT